ITTPSSPTCRARRTRTRGSIKLSGECRVVCIWRSNFMEGTSPFPSCPRCLSQRIPESDQGSKVHPTSVRKKRPWPEQPHQHPKRLGGRAEIRYRLSVLRKVKRAAKEDPRRGKNPATVPGPLEACSTRRRLPR